VEQRLRVEVDVEKRALVICLDTSDVKLAEEGSILSFIFLLDQLADEFCHESGAANTLHQYQSGLPTRKG
jgi:hypothetical protein